MTDVWFWAGGNQILSNINIRVNAGEFLCIVGPSGAGKSTLLRLIHMEIFPKKGSVIVADYNAQMMKKKEIPYLRRKVGVVFQDFKLLEDRDVFENVAFALWATGVRRSKIKKRIFQVLAEVGLSHKRYAMVPELSGGEQQKVAIARALVNEPFILLADEPTGNLDAESSDEILDLLKRINGRGMAILMTTHKEDLAKILSAKVLKIREGRMIE